MGRILFWVVLGVVAYALWRGWQRRRAIGREPRQPRAPRTDERMVACAYCGLNVPQSEAVFDDARAYCCEDHRRRATERA